MMIARRALRRLARAEDGLTIVEVVVAGMILIVGSLGVLGLVDAATRNTFRVEQSQTVSNVLQRELEQIREMPYDDVGLAALPAHESGENNPNSRIVSPDLYNTRREGTVLRSMVAGGALPAGPEAFQVEDVTGSIYRYVVSEGDFLKRAIVVVKLDSTAAGGADRPYQEIQTQVVDPEAKPANSPGPAPGGGTATWWSLLLTDTTCDAAKPQTAEERAEVNKDTPPPGSETPEPGSHLAHNTRGACSDGLTAGNQPGAPDLLWGAAPEIGEESESPVYDYATDVEPKVDPDRDKGLQLLKGADCSAMPATTVASAPDADPELFQKLHKWVTPPINTANLALTGQGELNLRTQSIEHGIYPATICIWLFVREGGTDTALTQTFGSLPYATYSAATWPSTGWTEITVSLDFKPSQGGVIALPTGARLGLALSVDDNSGSGIQTLYDEPTFDSRIVLATTGTLPSWP
jgi:hypothetical protein